MSFSTGYAQMAAILAEKKRKKDLLNAIATMERFREEQTGEESAFLKEARLNDPDDPFKAAGVSPQFGQPGRGGQLTAEDAMALIRGFTEPGSNADVSMRAQMGNQIGAARTAEAWEDYPEHLKGGLTSPDQLGIFDAVTKGVSRVRKPRDITRTGKGGVPSKQTGVVDTLTMKDTGLGDVVPAFSPKSTMFEVGPEGQVIYTEDSGLQGVTGQRSFFNKAGTESADDLFNTEKAHRAALDFGDALDAIAEARASGVGPTGVSGRVIRNLSSAVDQASDIVKLVGVQGAGNFSDVLDQLNEGTIQDTGIKNAKLDALQFSLAALRAASETDSGDVSREELLRAAESNAPMFGGSDEQAYAAMDQTHSLIVDKVNRRTSRFTPQEGGKARFESLSPRAFGRERSGEGGGDDKIRTKFEQEGVVTGKDLEEWVEEEEKKKRGKK